MQTRVLTLAALAAALLPAAAGAQAAPERTRTVIRERAATAHAPAVRYQAGRETQTERTTRTLNIGPSGELSLGNIAGDIVVTRGSGDAASIEIVKTARARTADEARQMLQLVQVDVIERAGRAEIRTRYPENRERQQRRNVNVSVDYTVTAPAGTSVTVRTISGDVRISDITGDLLTESVSGDVRIANARQVTGAKSVSGDIEILDTTVEGTLEAASVSGDVVARRVKARRLSAGTVSGSVLADGVECERADAHSMSGDVEFTGALTRGGRYDLKSHSGDVRVTVGGDTGFEVEANSWSGNVRGDGFTFDRRSGDDSFRGRQRALRGVVGDGSAVLTITTFSGSVVVSKR